MSKSSRVNLVIFIFEVKVFVWSLLANPVGKLRQHITDMSSYYSFLNLAFMVAHGSFYKQDVPDRKCGKVSSLLLDQRSIDLNGAREKEGHFHYKNF